MNSFNPNFKTLMGPGPSNIDPRVLQAMSRPLIGHLDPQFIDLMDEIKALLRYAYQTENALTFPVSAPGYAGMKPVLPIWLSPAIKCWFALMAYLAAA